jgi:FMN-dependent NADH-azoreductase
MDSKQYAEASEVFYKSYKNPLPYFSFINTYAKCLRLAHNQKMSDEVLPYYRNLVSEKIRTLTERINNPNTAASEKKYAQEQKAKNENSLKIINEEK